MDNYFEIGVVAGTHGIRGNLKVFPTTSEPERFELLKEVIVELRGRKNTYKIESVAFHKQFVLLKLSGINDMTEAEKYKRARILIDEKYAIPLEEDEYYTRDLYDMEVFTEEGELLGVIDDIIETGANDVYSVKNVSEEGGKNILIPAIKQCIVNVDVKNKKMVVRLLEGLREI